MFTFMHREDEPLTKKQFEAQHVSFENNTLQSNKQIATAPTLDQT